MKLNLIALVASFFLSWQTAAQDWQWAKSIQLFYRTEGELAATDNWGNIYMLGYCHITYAKQGFFLIKYSPTGEAIWTNVLPEGIANSEFPSIAVDNSGNLYITGSFFKSLELGNSTLTAPNSDMFLAKYDSAGHILWAKSSGNDIDTSYIQPHTIICDSLNNIFVSTDIYSLNNYKAKVIMGGTTIEGHSTLSKCDSSGNFIWTKSSDGYFTSRPGNLTTDGTGNVYMTGNYRDTITFGTYTLTADSANSTFLVKYDSSGEVLWAKDAKFWSNGSYISSDLKGNVYMTGDFYCSTDLGGIILESKTNTTYIAKYNSLGRLIWAKNVYGSLRNFPWSVATDLSNDVYITGWYSGTISIDTVIFRGNENSAHLFLLKLDEGGSVKWGFSGDTALRSSGASLAVDKFGNCYVTGDYANSITFGSTTLTSTSVYTMFVAKFFAKSSVTPPPDITEEGEIALYPNPTSRNITLKFNKNISINTVEIFNLLGAKVGECILKDPSDHFLEIELPALPDGMYVFQATGKNYQKKFKVNIRR